MQLQAKTEIIEKQHKMTDLANRFDLQISDMQVKVDRHGHDTQDLKVYFLMFSQSVIGQSYVFSMPLVLCLNSVDSISSDVFGAKSILVIVFVLTFSK